MSYTNKYHFKHLIFLAQIITILCCYSCVTSTSSEENYNHNNTRFEIPPLHSETPLRFISPKNPNIDYIGRFDFSNPATPRFAYSGCGIRTKFYGDTVAIYLEHNPLNGYEFNYYQVFLDDEEFILKVNKHDTVYAIAGDLSQDWHELSVLKRTESRVGRCKFEGLVVRSGVELNTIPRKPRRIEFIGNSITSGYGCNLSVADPSKCHFTPENESFFQSYAGLTAEILEAEYSAISYSGIGVSRDYAGVTNNTMINMYDKILPDNYSSPKWSYNSQIPQVVVVNLGTNDFARGIPEENRFVQAYLKLLYKIRSNYPDAYIICAGGSMISDVFPAHQHQHRTFKHYVKKVVRGFKRNRDKNIDHLIFDYQRGPYGEDWHPAFHTHQAMALELSEVIRKKLGW